MAQERGSAVVVMVVLCLLVVVLQCEVTHATTYHVGDEPGGWTFGVMGWENGKNFKVNDILVFNYKRGKHNVVAVNTTGYDGCNTMPANARVYKSGNDSIKLVRGLNNFICSFPLHCGMGMKIQASAS